MDNKPHVDIPTQDYAANHADSLAKLKALVADLQDTSKVRPAETIPAVVMASIVQAQADFLEQTPPATVLRYVAIPLKCKSKGGVIHEFTASFDEVQRTIPCPVCRKEVHIPEDYRGTP